MTDTRRGSRDDSVWGRSALPATESSVLSDLASLAESTGLPTDVLDSARQEADERSTAFDVGLSEQFLFRKLA
jgi:hypothetical protein